MPSIKLMMIYKNEGKTICKKRCLVYWGQKKRRYSKRQRGRGIPFGLIASAAAPFLGEVAKPLLKKKNWC